MAPSTLGGDHGAAAARRLWPGEAAAPCAGVGERNFGEEGWRKRKRAEKIMDPAHWQPIWPVVLFLFFIKVLFEFFLRKFEFFFRHSFEEVLILRLRSDEKKTSTEY